ncbi:MAG: hypothetical protein R3C03_02030 [Pirellulaceae bacterium]
MYRKKVFVFVVVAATANRMARFVCRLHTFLQRILNHVPSPGMPTVRGYGPASAGCKREELNHARQQCGQREIEENELQPMRWQEFCVRIGRSKSTQCPICGNALIHEPVELSERAAPPQ